MQKNKELLWAPEKRYSILIHTPYTVVGSTHDVTITDEFDEGFKALAESRHGGVGGTADITGQKPESFNFEEIKKHTHTKEEEDDDEQLIQL